MEISLAGIEAALGELRYRESSPKARLVRTIHTFYKNSTSPGEVRVIGSDELIDRMWDLGGDQKAIRTRRKNLSSIRSSVNQDLDRAWEEGRNPEGITIGPMNTFVMSDAAKDRILNSFAGSMNLEGGNSLEQVAEALKIVSDYLSELPDDMEGSQVANLKSIIEGLSEKIGSGNDVEIQVVEKKVEGDGKDDENQAVTESEDAEDEDEIEVMDESDLSEEVEEIEDDFEDADDFEEVLEDWVDEAEDDSEIELEDADELEILEEDEIAEEADEELFEIEDEDRAGGEDGGEDIVELMDAEGLEDADEIEIVYEDEPEEDEGGEAYDETGEVVEEGAEEAESVDEDDFLEETEDDFEEVMDDTEATEDDVEASEDLEFVEDEENYLEETEASPDEIGEDVEVEDVDDLEIMDEEDMVEVDDDLEEVEADDEADLLEDAEEMEEDEDLVEIVGTEGLEDAEEVEVVDADDVIEEMDDIDDIEEVDGDDLLDAADGVDDDLEEDLAVVEEEEDEGTEIDTDETLGNNIGLPIDQLMEDVQNLDEFQLDERQKRLLAEQFDGYLGAMERYYNQYILIKKGSYRVGSDASEEDTMQQQKVLMAEYYMGKYPVTNALFEVFIERTGYRTTAEKLGYGYVYHGRFRKVVDPKTGFTSSIWNSTFTREKVEGATWYQPLGPGSTLHRKRNHPVVQVSIKDARTFAAWTGKRLPSEIEWEAAARTQTGFRYPWGNEWIEGFCNFESSGISDTCPVDHNPHGANEEGLADLLGNVMEWTSDECEPKYSLEIPTRFFIAKGGSWISPEQTTLYSRSRFEADFTSNILGFRCLAD